MNAPTVVRGLTGALGAAWVALLLASCAPCSAEEREPDPTSAVAPVADADEPASVAGVTAAHNAVRASVDPAPSAPLPPLAWDDDLAAVAQAYADRCVYGHSQGEFGENLFAQANEDAAAEEVVRAWADEASLYDYGTGACSGKCGHYTQIVWRDSTRVGCGVASCATNSPFGSDFPTWQYWVCNYDPPGNWKGEKPY